MIIGADGRTKSGKSRVIPLFPPLRRLLDSIRARNNETAPQGRILLTESAKVALTNACRRLNCPHIHHHSLRHFFATNCLESAIPPNVVAGWLGHADGGALLLRTYGHLRPKHEAEMATRVNFDAWSPE